MLHNKHGMLFSCESCPKGCKTVDTESQTSSHENNISYLLRLYVLQLESIKPTTNIDLSEKRLIVLCYTINMVCYFHVNLVQRENS